MQYTCNDIQLVHICGGTDVKALLNHSLSPFIGIYNFKNVPGADKYLSKEKVEELEHKENE